MSKTPEKRFARQLYSELQSAVQDFINNPGNKLNPYLYDDISGSLNSTNTEKYIEIKNHFFFFNGEKRIINKENFKIPLKIIIISDIGLFFVRAQAEVSREIFNKYYIYIEDYTLEALVYEF